MRVISGRIGTRREDKIMWQFSPDQVDEPAEKIAEYPERSPQIGNRPPPERNVGQSGCLISLTSAASMRSISCSRLTRLLRTAFDCFPNLGKPCSKAAIRISAEPLGVLVEDIKKKANRWVSWTGGQNPPVGMFFHNRREQPTMMSFCPIGRRKALTAASCAGSLDGG